MFKKIISILLLVLTILTSFASQINASAESLLSSNFSVKLILVEKNGDSLYRVQGEEILVTKKFMSEVSRSLQDNNLKLSPATNIELGKTSVLPQAGGVAATVTFLMAKIGIWSWKASYWITLKCGSNPTGCASVVTGIWNGSNWAYQRVRSWARGGN